MLAALVIVFREAVEAGLIIGIVLAATRGLAHRGRWVAAGIAAGGAGATVGWGSVPGWRRGHSSARMTTARTPSAARMERVSPRRVIGVSPWVRR